MKQNDTYRTIEKTPENILFKDKNSKFYGYLFPIKTEDDVKSCLYKLKKKHHAARHWCYAYQLGSEQISYRVNDDGEPNNSAGIPIYGQIQSFNVTNVVIIIVRYFGGIKLGVGGLIQAYKTAAKMILEASTIVEKTINIHFLVSFDYKNMNTVMRLIKEKKLNVINQELALDCKMTLSIRKSEAEAVLATFNKLYEVHIKTLN